MATERKEFDLSKTGVLNGVVTKLTMVSAPKGEKVEKLTCDITHSPVKYLFTLTNGDKELNISAGALKSFLITRVGETEKGAQKIVDRLYNIGYNSGKGGASKRVTAEEKAAAVDAFLAVE